jgi:hypothetical protein
MPASTQNADAAPSAKVAAATSAATTLPAWFHPVSPLLMSEGVLADDPKRQGGDCGRHQAPPAVAASCDDGDETTGRQQGERARRHGGRCDRGKQTRPRFLIHQRTGRSIEHQSAMPLTVMTSRSVPQTNVPTMPARWREMDKAALHIGREEVQRSGPAVGGMICGSDACRQAAAVIITRVTHSGQRDTFRL